MWKEMDEAGKAQYVEQARLLKEALKDQLRELAHVARREACDDHAMLDPPSQHGLDATQPNGHVVASSSTARPAKPFKRPQPKECTNCHVLVSPNNYMKHFRKCITVSRPIKVGELMQPATTSRLLGTELFLWDDPHGWCPGRVESVNGLICSVRAQDTQGLEFVEEVILPEHNLHWKAFCNVAGEQLPTTIRVVRYGDGSPGSDGPPPGTSIYVKFGKGPAKKWWHARIVSETEAPTNVLAKRKAGTHLVEFFEDGGFAWVSNKDVELHDPALTGTPSLVTHPSPPTAAKTLVADTDEAKSVGDRIAVQWLLDKRAYTGTVTKRDPCGTRVLVAYDDGERHWAEWEGGHWVDTAEVSGDDEAGDDSLASLLPSVPPQGPGNPTGSVCSDGRKGNPATDHGRCSAPPKHALGTGRSTVVTTTIEPRKLD
jgi:hypothetical protein